MPELYPHESLLARADRWRTLDTQGGTVWMTGLPSSGKSTLANALEWELVHRGQFAYRLDGDNIRMGLNQNLGFSREDRAENIRRIAEVAHLFADAGCIAITAFISPYERDRARAREIHQGSDLPFLEVFVDAPIEVCERRDPKGLYAKARMGQLKGFTGVDDPYQAPQSPDLVVDTVALCVKECTQRILTAMAAQKMIAPLD